MTHLAPKVWYSFLYGHFLLVIIIECLIYQLQSRENPPLARGHGGIGPQCLVVVFEFTREKWVWSNWTVDSGCLWIFRNGFVFICPVQNVPMSLVPDKKLKGKWKLRGFDSYSNTFNWFEIRKMLCLFLFHLFWPKFCHCLIQSRNCMIRKLSHTCKFVITFSTTHGVVQLEFVFLIN